VCGECVVSVVSECVGECGECGECVVSGDDCVVSVVGEWRVR
jgi:hypothetical protein